MWKNTSITSAMVVKFAVDRVVGNVGKVGWKMGQVLHSRNILAKFRAICGLLNTVQNPLQPQFFHRIYTLGIEAILDAIDLLADGDV